MDPPCSAVLTDPQSRRRIAPTMHPSKSWTKNGPKNQNPFRIRHFLATRVMNATDTAMRAEPNHDALEEAIPMRRGRSRNPPVECLNTLDLPITTRLLLKRPVDWDRITKIYTCH